MAKSQDRTKQKERTRRAILEGARMLLARGETVTVVQAAELQGISKATAYRYFSDPAILVAEAGLDIEVASFEEVVAGIDGLRAQLMAINLYIFDLAMAHEAQFRQFVGMTLISNGKGERSHTRGARRVAMYERAIEESGTRFAPKARAALVRALTASTGVEAVIALIDIAGADAKTARATVEDVTHAILDRHLGPKGL